MFLFDLTRILNDLHDFVADFCGIPEDEQVMSIIAVGYRSESVSNKPPRKSVDDVAKFI